MSLRYWIRIYLLNKIGGIPVERIGGIPGLFGTYMKLD
jgi:hypothetical protein